MVTHIMLRTHAGKNMRIVTGLDLTGCLKQIKYQRLHLTCAPISELPSNIRTMGVIIYYAGQKWLQ